jgi:hypothetical protein
MEKKIPEVGMGATIQHWSDRTPATIIQVAPNLKQIVLQEDKSVRTDNNGMSEYQEYTFSTDTEGRIFTATLRKDGRYRLTGSKELVSIGTRSKFYDFSF